MNSFAVIRYFNYRKEVSFTILKTFDSIKNADKYAFRCARDDFGEKDVVEGVSEQRVYVDSVLSHGGYTKGDGYDNYVYTVVEIPEPDYSVDDSDDDDSDDDSDDEFGCPPTPVVSDEESECPSDEESCSSDESELEIVVQDNGKYEWGFDLTSFGSEEGAEKFQELLDMFNLKLRIKSNMGKNYTVIESAYTWTNYDDDWTSDKDALMLVTANNPITGEYMNKTDSNKEMGYLSYVGVVCNSRKTLERFLTEFRNKAVDIKGESNYREYI